MFLHVTPDLAGLLAQVFPTLMIALLLEGRLMHDRQWAPVFTQLVYYVRVFALLSASVTTFVCLLVASNKHEMLLVDIVATASLWSLVLTFGLLIGHVTGPESPSRRNASPDIARSLPASPADSQGG